MQYSCLSRTETATLLQYAQGIGEIENSELRHHVELAEYWEHELNCLSYVIAIILEGFNEQETKRKLCIDELYELSDRINLYVQELDVDFVIEMLKGHHLDNINLEEELIEIQLRLRGYQHG